MYSCLHGGSVLIICEKTRLQRGRKMRIDELGIYRLLKKTVAEQRL
jgi:hypothetical protein